MSLTNLIYLVPNLDTAGKSWQILKHTSVCITFIKLKPCTSWRHWKRLKERRSVSFSVACLNIAPQQLRSPIRQSLLAGSGQSSSLYKAWHWNLDPVRTVLCNLETLCNIICIASISSQHHIILCHISIILVPVLLAQKKCPDEKNSLLCYPERSQKSQVLRRSKSAISGQTQPTFYIQS